MAYLRVSIKDVSFQSCQVVENSLKKMAIIMKKTLVMTGRLTKICLETERHLKSGQQDAKMATAKKVTFFAKTKKKSKTKTKTNNANNDKDLFCVGNVVTDGVQRIKG